MCRFVKIVLRLGSSDPYTPGKQVSDDYVFSLQLKQLLSHIDLELLFKQLPNLTRLELTYGYALC